MNVFEEAVDDGECVCPLVEYDVVDRRCVPCVDPFLARGKISAGPQVRGLRDPFHQRDLLFIRRFVVLLCVVSPYARLDQVFRAGDRLLLPCSLVVDLKFVQELPYLVRFPGIRNGRMIDIGPRIRSGDTPLRNVWIRRAGGRREGQSGSLRKGWRRMPGRSWVWVPDTLLHDSSNSSFRDVVGWCVEEGRDVVWLFVRHGRVFS